MDKDKIWESFRAGDKTAFESIYRLCIDDMYAYGTKLNPNKELVKDCVQQVFIDIYERRHNISQPNNIKFYILKALKHTIYKKQKKEGKKTSLENFSGPEFRANYNFEEKRIRSEIDSKKQELIQKAIISLSSRQQEIMYLRFTIGLKYSEIGEIIKIDPSSVRKQVYRSIKKLRSNQVFEDYKGIVLFYANLPKH